jgi:hypothetical protein
MGKYSTIGSRHFYYLDQGENPRKLGPDVKIITWEEQMDPSSEYWVHRDKPMTMAEHPSFQWKGTLPPRKRTGLPRWPSESEEDQEKEKDQPEEVHVKPANPSPERGVRRQLEDMRCWSSYNRFCGPRVPYNVVQTNTVVGGRTVHEGPCRPISLGETVSYRVPLHLNKNGRSFNWFQGHLPLQPPQPEWFSYFGLRNLERFENRPDPYIWEKKEPRLDHDKRLAMEALMERFVDLEEQYPDLAIQFVATQHFRLFYRNPLVHEPDEQLVQYFGPGERVLSMLRLITEKRI